MLGDAPLAVSSQIASQPTMSMRCSGVTDVGTGLQAVAAAITDPDTISAFQTENRDSSMSHRTFYGGMHELSGGLDDAASGIHELAKVLFCLLLPPCLLCKSLPTSSLACWHSYGNSSFVAGSTPRRRCV